MTGKEWVCLVLSDDQLPYPRWDSQDSQHVGAPGFVFIQSRDSRTKGMGVQMVLFVWKGSPFFFQGFGFNGESNKNLRDEKVWTEMGSPNFLGRIVRKSEPGNPSAVKLLMEEIRLTSW